jgi:hypothetical protein
LTRTNFKGSNEQELRQLYGKLDNLTKTFDAISMAKEEIRRLKAENSDNQQVIDFHAETTDFKLIDRAQTLEGDIKINSGEIEKLENRITDLFEALSRETGMDVLSMLNEQDMEFRTLAGKALRPYQDAPRGNPSIDVRT